MTLRIPAKALIQVWSYDFYDMTLSTGKQRRHIIKLNRVQPSLYIQKQSKGNSLNAFKQCRICL